MVFGVSSRMGTGITSELGRYGLPMAKRAPNSDETDLALLRAMVDEIRRVGVANARVSAVLSEVNVSPSSLYHHFGSKEELVVAAQLQIAREDNLNEDAGILEIGKNLSTHEEFLAFITLQLRRAATDPANIPVREARVIAAASSFGNPDFPSGLSRPQRALIEATSEVFRSAQERGIANPDLDAFAYAAFFHGLTLSLALINRNLTEVEDWLAIAIPAALAPIRMK